MTTAREGVKTMISDARSLWELIERRVDETPDALLAVDEDKRTMTFAEYRDAAERAAAGFAQLGVRAGTPVSWQLPTWIESIVLVGALSRVGAVQNPILPIYREREVGFVAKQTGAQIVIVPSKWKGFDFEAMARAIAEGQPGLEVLVVDRTLPDGDPQSLPPAVTPPDDPAELPIRWAFYTSGTTADPKGAKHTDRTIMASAYGMAVALELTEQERRAFHSSSARASPWPARARRSTWHISPRSASSRARRCSPTCARSRAARHPSRPSSTTTSSPRWVAWGSSPDMD